MFLRCSPLLLLAACGTPHAEYAGNEIALGADTDEPPAPAVAARRSKPIPWCLEGDTSCGGDGNGAVDRPGDSAPLDPNHRYAVTLSADDPIKGPPLAPVTLVVFSDFQCPYCRRLATTLAELSFKYPTELRVVWKDLPLPGHAHALPAALLGRAAYAQGGSRLFWQVHDALFTQQAELEDRTLERIAQRFGLAWPPDERHQRHLDATSHLVRELSVNSTPTTFVNGRPVIGAKRLDTFVELVEAELEGDPGASPPALQHD